MNKKQEILDKLFALHRFGIKPGLERTLALCESAGNPHRSFPAIHVAGTNGKGAVCSMIASILMEAGYRVGLYTSPHIKDFNERIRINGRAISDDDIVRLSGGLFLQSDKNGCTFFEITTVMAFQYFAERKVDIAVIETGMGGRFDSTNILDPIISVITPIALDHSEYLGSTIESVAFEKAGIIKKGRPVICGKNDPVALAVIRKRTEVSESGLFPVSEMVSIGNSEPGKGNSIIVDITTPGKDYSSLEIGLLGSHQAENACTAIVAAEQIRNRFRIDDKHIYRGLKNVKSNSVYHCRIDLVRDDPKLLIDVAHNPQAMDILVRTLKQNFGNSSKWTIIFGAMADKEISTMLHILKPVARKLIATKPDIERAASTGSINKTAEKAGIRSVREIESVPEAVGMMIKSGEDTLVVGSFYLAGEAAAIICDLKLS